MNYVAVEEPPNDMYGKLMSLPDGLIVPYYEYLTDLSDEEIEELGNDLATDKLNPMEPKKQLAWDITSQFHDPSAADGAQRNFERVIQRKSLPDEMLEFTPTEPGYFRNGGKRLSNLMVDAGLVSSATEAKRLINQGAVSLIPEGTGDPRTLGQDYPLSELARSAQDVLKVGRRRFVRLLDG